MTEALRCCICSQILGDSSNDLIAQILVQEPYVRRVPFETSLFAVIPSLGPLVPGHVLLCPKYHYRSFSGLPNEFEHQLNGLKRRLTQLLLDLYKLPVHYFEHGMARDGDHVLCTVEHAHLHAVPASVEVWDRLQSQGIWEVIGLSLNDLKRAVGNDEYLYYESPNGAAHVMRVEAGKFESQYLRRVFADALQCSDKWNWREFPSALTTHETFELLRDASRPDS
jgi:diadenosine tetraphosphate (Ap4A) HIT family hydrolase